MPELLNHYVHTIPPDAIWIMRGKSILANRWTHKWTAKTHPAYRCDSREEAVAKFEVWLRRKVFEEHDELVCEALDAIQEDSKLVCCCLSRTVKICHGCVIIQVWQELYERKKK